MASVNRSFGGDLYYRLQQRMINTKLDKETEMKIAANSLGVNLKTYTVLLLSVAVKG